MSRYKALVGGPTGAGSLDTVYKFYRWNESTGVERVELGTGSNAGPKTIAKFNKFTSPFSPRAAVACAVGADTGTTHGWSNRMMAYTDDGGDTWEVVDTSGLGTYDGICSAWIRYPGEVFIGTYYYSGVPPEEGRIYRWERSTGTFTLLLQVSGQKFFGIGGDQSQNGEIWAVSNQAFNCVWKCDGYNLTTWEDMTEGGYFASSYNVYWVSSSEVYVDKHYGTKNLAVCNGTLPTTPRWTNSVSPAMPTNCTLASWVQSAYDGSWYATIRNATSNWGVFKAESLSDATWTKVYTLYDSGAIGIRGIDTCYWDPAVFVRIQWPGGSPRLANLLVSRDNGANWDRLVCADFGEAPPTCPIATSGVATFEYFPQGGGGGLTPGEQDEIYGGEEELEELYTEFAFPLRFKDDCDAELIPDEVSKNETIKNTILVNKHGIPLVPLGVGIDEHVFEPLDQNIQAYLTYKIRDGMDTGVDQIKATTNIAFDEDDDNNKLSIKAAYLDTKTGRRKMSVVSIPRQKTDM